ncbi:MAG TPA: PD-(D/E)XK motif protein [Pyrinomonadaceae bacterium]|nr:PD-(D/E)XK motif protein [Pyrinomonadaceae bacterium]
MSTRLEGLFDAIALPEPDGSPKPIYAVVPVPGYESYFVGKDRDGCACLLVAAGEHSERMHSPIRLENLDVQFQLRCHLRRKDEVQRMGTFTVVRCRSLDAELTRYFLLVCDTIIARVGDQPKQGELAAAILRLAAIFQKMQKPASRPLNGLFGELFFIWSSASPPRAVAAWRVNDTARFDFAEANVRIDVKATSGRLRSHTFSYEQCNPPPGTIAVVISLFVERSPGGISLRSLVNEVETRIAAFPDMILKLHETVAETLGSSLSEAMGAAFDTHLAESSMKLYSLLDVPAIRGPLPPGVSEMHFRSDLSSMCALSKEALVRHDSAFRDLLPQL